MLPALLPTYQVLQVTYPEVGATRGELPTGYRHTRHCVELGSGRVTFERAVSVLCSWDLHRHVGLNVAARGDAAPGETVVLGVGWGLALVVPCRVVYVEETYNRRGFGYGTLPGHPESGEEAFVITIDDHGVVRFEITAFSRPGGRITRVAGPIATAIQSSATRRYGRTMAGLTVT